MFEEDYAHHKKIASRTPGYDEANYAGKAAMIDLGFNMGQWWPKWPNTSKALKEGDIGPEDFEDDGQTRYESDPNSYVIKQWQIDSWAFSNKIKEENKRANKEKQINQKISL